MKALVYILNGLIAIRARRWELGYQLSFIGAAPPRWWESNNDLQQRLDVAFSEIEASGDA